MVYYHGTDEMSLSLIEQEAKIDCGRGELGRGFYVGSSLWRAFSWAWHKANKKGTKSYGVISYEINENKFCNLSILCLNRQSTERKYAWLKKLNLSKRWYSNHDAIWAPLVGGGIKDVYQIKFQSKKGEEFINQQKHSILWPKQTI